jgi:purine-binding chemotaxis protein CheW
MNETSKNSYDLLIFEIGDDHFGIDIRSVQELCNYSCLTRLVEDSRLIEGVASRNGAIMPMVDFRKYFRSGVLLYDDLTSVIIVRVRDRSICLIVDRVLATTSLTSTQVEDISESGAPFHLDGLVGMAPWGGRQFFLLDLNKVLSVP